MAIPIKRGEPGSQVSEWFPLSNKVTVTQAPKIPILNPHGLPVRHTLHSTAITNATTTGSVITFTAQNRFIAGQTVTIDSAITTGSYTVASATTTQFTINSALSILSTGGTAVLTTSPIIPSKVTWLWAVCVGAGSSGSSGGLTTGWALAGSNYVIGMPTGSGATLAGTYTRYGHIMAGSLATLGGGGTSALGAGINYWGQPGGAVTSASGTVVFNGAGGGGGITNTTTATTGLNGGNGISGGNGQSISAGNSAGTTFTGGNGGNGFVGGSGGGVSVTAGTTVGGNGGNGCGIDGTIYTGSAGNSSNTTAGGGGGAGIAGDGILSGTAGRPGIGGLGGGAGGVSITLINPSIGTGGGGLIYLCY
jgi:hypothetical protein